MVLAYGNQCQMAKAIPSPKPKDIPSRTQEQEQDSFGGSQNSEIQIPDLDLLGAFPKDLSGSACADEVFPVPAPVRVPATMPDSPVANPRVSPFMRSITPPDSDELWVFQRWAAVFEKPDAQFDQGRAACLAARLIAGMPRQDAADALRGAAANDFVMGRKDGKRHDWLSFIFEKQERFEEFRDSGRALREGRDPNAPRVDPKRAEAAKRRAEAMAGTEARRIAELNKQAGDRGEVGSFDVRALAGMIGGES